MKRHKRISTDYVLTKTFKSLYSLSVEKRDYQFRPLRVIADKIIASIKEKIPNKLWKKISSKISEKINTDN